jgi:hypothetical protein
MRVVHEGAANPGADAVVKQSEVTSSKHHEIRNERTMGRTFTFSRKFATLLYFTTVG